MKQMLAVYLLCCSSSLLAGNSIKGLYYQPETGGYFGLTSFYIKNYDYEYSEDLSKTDYSAQSETVSQGLYYAYNKNVRLSTTLSYVPQKKNKSDTTTFDKNGFHNPTFRLNYFLEGKTNDQTIITTSFSPSLIHTKYGNSNKTGTVANSQIWFSSTIAKHQALAFPTNWFY